MYCVWVVCNITLMLHVHCLMQCELLRVVLVDYVLLLMWHSRLSWLYFRRRAFIHSADHVYPQEPIVIVQYHLYLFLVNCNSLFVSHDTASHAFHCHQRLTFGIGKT